MKPRLAIYGDSFATALTRNGLQARAWVSQLDDLYSVSHMALPSTSVYWSYRRFLNTYQDYDRVIFVVTCPNRVTVAHVQAAGGPLRATSLHQLLWFKEQFQPFDRLVDKTITALEQYYTYLHDPQEDMVMCDLMVQDVMRRRPDSLVIPISRSDLAPPCLADRVSFSDLQALIIRSLKPEYQEIFDQNYGWIIQAERQTQCHMTLEANDLMAQWVKTALATGQWAPSIPQMLAHENPWDYYYAEEPALKSRESYYAMNDPRKPPRRWFS
jgi:hypothetical protein